MRPQKMLLMQREHVNTGNYRQRDKNCAMYSAAGVLNLRQGKNLWSTGMVSEAFGTTDMKTGMGDDVTAQVQNLVNFCKPMSGAKHCYQIGEMNKEVGFASAQAFMDQFTDGTVFAVNVSGPMKDDIKGTRKCHWLNAVKKGGVIEFIDFQGDNQGLNNASATSDTPILAITHETFKDPEMVVLAFSDTPMGASASSSSSAPKAVDTNL